MKLGNFGPKIGNLVLRGKEMAPDAAVYAGLVAVIGGTAWLVKRSANSSDKISEYEKKVAQIKNMEHIKTSEDLENYSKEQWKKDLFKVRKDFAVELLKVYGPPIATVVIGTGGVLYGRHLFKVRNLALMGSNVALQSNLDSLTKKVDEALGVGTARRFMNGITEETVEVETVDQNGKKKKKKEKREIVRDRSKISPFSEFFDESSRKYHKSAALNLMAIQSVEDEYTRKLHKVGFVSLAEVYLDGCEMVDVPDEKKKLWQQYGWKLGAGDDRIDLGIRDNNGERVKINLLNSHESVFLMTPNIDGDIFTLLAKERGLI